MVSHRMIALSDGHVWLKYTRVDTTSKCWEWEGFKNAKGYGQTFRLGKTVRAHQLAWAIFNGPIPTGLVVRHKCDNPGCANPHHLELGTIQDNTRDRDERGRTARGERAGRAKITEDDVRAIRSAPKAPRAVNELVSQYGLAAQTIWAIRAGRSWRHIN